MHFTRSTPVECLHTILLGICKYMLRSFMDNRSKQEKEEMLARIKSFSYCGFKYHITGNIAYHYRSFVGRDFKAFIQMAIFIVAPFISVDERKCWLLLSKVLYMCVIFLTCFCRYSNLLIVIIFIVIKSKSIRKFVKCL